ncbi:MAG TPA: hypothetical protein VMF66_13060 [Candidatus Acidoferrum sp.]|nr:hypothetical protein [Candidatus Acidoferrum sp.]
MTSRPTFAVPAVLLASFAFAVPVSAQGRAGDASAHPAHFASGRHAQAPPFIAGRGDRLTHRRRSFYNDGVFYPDLFPSDYESGEPEEPLVEPIIVQPSAPAESRQPATKPIEPLVLEDHNGQWTRVAVGSEVSVGAQPSPPNAIEPRLPSSDSVAEGNSAPAVGLPPAVLVFRNGRQEQVRNYMIQGNDIYTKADYWSTGSWTRKIPLTDLDVPATLKLNSDRGTKFNLPRSPNQVVVRF